MRSAITALYVVAVLLSVWGVVGPWLSARRQRKKGERAQVRALELTIAASEAQGEEEKERARQRRDEEMSAPFEDGPETLSSLTQSVLYGADTGARRAERAARDRLAGLAWVVAGVVLGSLASVLALWFL